LDSERDLAFLTDTSTNGTRLNNNRIERAVATRLRPGDRIRVGRQELEFRSSHFTGTVVNPATQTRALSVETNLVMVAGDIITYSTISEYTASDRLMDNVSRLYDGLHGVLSKHHGTLNNYMGDAFFAIWEIDHNPRAAEDAVGFALDAAQFVDEISPTLELRDAEGQPIRMGWAVGQGLVSIKALTGMLITVLGDPTNLVFRISGLSGRDGRPLVMVTEDIRNAAGEGFTFDRPEEVVVKGRVTVERIYAASRPESE
jgi:class 3 adenylate cyclase